jgi:gliding motility-associated-like protein
LKNSNNHIDELFQKGIEQVDIQPPQDLWNQVSQSWDQVVQGHLQSTSQTSSTVSTTNSSTASIQGMSAKLGSISQWSSLSKWILGVVGTAVVGGGIYFVAELASPETQIQNLDATLGKSKQNEENSIDFNNGKHNSEESKELNETMGQVGSTPEFLPNNSYNDTPLTVVGSKLNSNHEGIHVKQELSNQGDQKASGNQRDVLQGESTKGHDRANSLGSKSYLELIQRNVRVEQVENRIQVNIDGVSELKAVIKSVTIGKEKIQSMGNSGFIRGDFEGWELPNEGNSLVFERKCYLETSKKLTVQITVKFVDSDKAMVEKDIVIEKQIEIQPWIAGGTEIIPNVFTPNGDGLNDEYYVIVKEPKSFQMVISSAERSDLGTVFQANVVSERWNGKKGEIVCPEGKYWVSIRRVYERIDNQGKWVTATKVERILMELKRD